MSETPLPPVQPAPGEIPADAGAALLPCHWYENPDHPGERFLVPCCPERLQDLETQCRCELPVQELARLRREMAVVRAQLTAKARDLSALICAVHEHPDLDAIYARARQIRQGRGARSA